MRIIGIDPGKEGAIALIDGHKLVHVIDMPLLKLKKGTKVCGHTLHSQLADMLHPWPPIDLAVIEAVHATPQMGVTSAFDFGRSFAMVEMAIIARGIRLEYVQPQAWKKALGLNADKSGSLALARAKWPDSVSFKLKKHEGRAEAALIAAWARRAGL
jgi:crossover junction endodeoxyribonuclease RuvC